MNFYSLMNGRESVPALARDCVHVWRISSAANGGLEWAEEILSEEERGRAAKFHFEKDRRSFLVCRGMLRRLISLYTKQDAAGIRFHTGSHGKPSLLPADASGLQFNVSHSRELALLGFSMDAAIGVDVEFKRAGVDFIELAEHSFSDAERAAVLACSAAERANLFYEYWSCKEACIKADGRGLSIPLGEFTVTSGKGNPQWREIISSESSGLPAGMRNRIINVGDDYAAAVATNIPSWDIIQLDLDFLRSQDSANEPSRLDSQDRQAVVRVPDNTRSKTNSSAASSFSVSEGGRR
jgi:4'-phosphopantetheinyl transferase